MAEQQTKWKKHKIDGLSKKAIKRRARKEAIKYKPLPKGVGFQRIYKVLKDNKLVKEAKSPNAIWKELAKFVTCMPNFKYAPSFYNSKEWRVLRYKVLEKYGAKCQVCGRGREDGCIMHVDHIKPKSKYPELSLDINNLQVMCEDCNMGKLNMSEKDWR